MFVGLQLVFGRRSGGPKVPSSNLGSPTNKVPFKAEVLLAALLVGP
ncbi:uncharacterized protein METZ01_LOCUS218065 [marine metagenome]|uniref:Uncharacterized protein n=1 Tax=marine metagenome TaxID=408172 RepID=A0A382FTB3_9ZZZZ